MSAIEFEVLLAAWPRVHEAVPEARLVIAGRPMGVELPATPPAGAEFVSRFVSEEELGWLLRRADVCALPYTRIDMSGIASAALACDTPLVLSDIGGFGEYVGNGGVTVPVGDSDALATQLIELLADPARRAQLAAEAAEAVRTTYSWDAIAADYVERLGALVSARAGA